MGLCLSEETLKAGGPFHLVSMPGEVKDPTQLFVIYSELRNSRWPLNALQRAPIQYLREEKIEMGPTLS